MTANRDSLRDWHRLFGLLLTDFFTGSPFVVEVERDLSQQQQLLDVVIVRRRRGKSMPALPDGLGDLAEHNLITFKSWHESLDDWAIRELLGAYVAYRKLVSPSPSDLLPADRFRLYAVASRFPQNLADRVPWEEGQAGVYDCQWGLDTIRVVVAGRLPREANNAPLHLFSASPELLGFAQAAYRQRSAATSQLLGQLFERLRGEGFAMSYTMEDFKRDYVKEHFPRLSPEEQEEVLRTLRPEQRLAGLPPEQRLAGLPPEQRLAGLPPEQRLAGLSVEQMEQLRQHLDRMTAKHPAEPRKPRRKK
jgi:hypothetical protein